MPTVAEWHSRCDRKVAISLCFWNAHSKPAKSKSVMKKEYSNLSKRLKDLVPNCGNLGMSHSMSVMSELGLVPSNPVDFCCTDYGTPWEFRGGPT